MSVIIFFIPLLIGLFFLFRSYMINRTFNTNPSDSNINTIYDSLHKSSRVFLIQQGKIIIITLISIISLLSIYTLLIYFIRPDDDLLHSFILFTLTFVLGAFLSWIAGFKAIQQSTGSLGRLIGSLSQDYLNPTKLKQLGLSISMTVFGQALIHLTLLYLIMDVIYSPHFLGLFAQLDWPLLNELIASDLKGPTYLHLSFIGLGYCLGTSSQALFTTVGGSIFAKTNDISADLLGQLDFNVDKHNLSNPSIIASYVGNHIKNVFSYAVNMYESYIFTIIILTLFIAGNLHYNEEIGSSYYLFSPLLISALGVLISMIVAQLTKSNKLHTQRHYMVNIICSSLLIGLVSSCLVPLGVFSTNILISIWVGLGLGLIIAANSTWQQSGPLGPTKTVLEQTQISVLNGITSGMSRGILATIIPIIATLSCIAFCFIHSGGVHAFWPALSSVGWVSLGCVSVTMSKFIIGSTTAATDIAYGIAQITDAPSTFQNDTFSANKIGNIGQVNINIDSLVNTFLIATLLIVVYMDFIWWRLFKNCQSAIYFVGDIGFTVIESLVNEANNIHMIVDIPYRKLLNLFNADMLNPELIIGLLIGSFLPFVFMAIILMAIECGLKKVSQSMHEQLTQNTSILNGSGVPDYYQVILISLKNAMKWLIFPGIITILLPIFSSILFGISGSIGLIMGSLVSSFILGAYLIHSGNLWQQTNRLLEHQRQGQELSATYISAIVGNALGNILKDSVGFSLSILIKMTLLILIFTSYLAIIFESLMQ
ncbi:hypothetical protein HOH45_07820 [bacterium]|nr:hypothetical protein [bacterium]